MKFDLHIHTNFSDGLLKPREVVDLAINKNIDTIAITDHDNTDAFELASNYNDKHYKNKLDIICGIEFGCLYEEEEIHILGYNIDYKDKELQSLIRILKEKRIERAKKIINKLIESGFKLSYDEILEKEKNDFIGRPHIARLLVEKGYVDNVKKAFKYFLNRNSRYFVERYKLDTKETIELINKLGGVSVLAHPGQLKDSNNIFKSISWGINGIECVHSDHSNGMVKKYKKIAREHDLIITGGSDCHGNIIDGDYLLGKYYVEYENKDFLRI